MNFLNYLVTWMWGCISLLILHWREAVSPALTVVLRGWGASSSGLDMILSTKFNFVCKYHMILSVMKKNTILCQMVVFSVRKIKQRISWVLIWPQLTFLWPSWWYQRINLKQGYLKKKSFFLWQQKKRLNEMFQWINLNIKIIHQAEEICLGAEMSERCL